jgi:hypothetical protein
MTCPTCGHKSESTACHVCDGNRSVYQSGGVNGLLQMKCPQCNGEKYVRTMDHGICRCGVCQFTGIVKIDPRTLVMR